MNKEISEALKDAVLTLKQSKRVAGARKISTEIERIEAENSILRYLLWLRHGCDITSLYGDDGEMQCSKHGIDFKRLPAESIKECFFAINNFKLRRNTTVEGDESK